MPELPELEIARRQLVRWLGGRRIVAARALDAASVRRTLSSRPADAVADPPLHRLRGAPEGFARHGKRVGFRVGDAALIAHFGMTGFLARHPSGDPAPPLARFALDVDDGRSVVLIDGRRFGCVAIVDAGDLGAALADGHGPDALDAPLDAEGLAAALGARKKKPNAKPVKVALMEQERLAGLGNIHAAEACFRARLHPETPVARVDAAGWAALAAAIPAQLAWAIAEGDGDEVAYVNLGGPNPFSVYGRAGAPCPTCATPIAEAELGGRTTFWCPTCQAPAPAPS